MHIEDKAALGVLESALAAAEDESDVQAARTAKAEAAAELAEFDENIPFDDANDTSHVEAEMSKAEMEMNLLVEQVKESALFVYTFKLDSVIIFTKTSICLIVVKINF